MRYLDYMQRKKFIEELGKLLNIQTMEDWYRITKDQIVVVNDKRSNLHSNMEVPPY